MKNIRTGLALEAMELAQETGGLTGVVHNEYDENDAHITLVEITDENGKKALNREIGKYITIEMGKVGLSEPEKKEAMASLLIDKIKGICELNENSLVLVCGLGNRQITPDALGPEVANRIIVTRHIKQINEEEFAKYNLGVACSIAPGVLGQTGLESAEILKSISDMIKPDLIIAIDALASRKMSRLANTVEITNTGITPGGGIGNERAEISQSVFGVPVVAIGVPTVVDAATLATDVMDKVENTNDEDKYQKIKATLEPFDMNLIVTPNDIDKVIMNMVEVISLSINKLIHTKLEFNDILSLA